MLLSREVRVKLARRDDDRYRSEGVDGAEAADLVGLHAQGLHEEGEDDREVEDGAQERAVRDDEEILGLPEADAKRVPEASAAI